MLIYLPPEELIVELHDAILEVSGGRPGILNRGVIDAAVSRPKTYLAYHPECDLHTVCAVLLDSLARNHAFVEGNKRTGLMAAILTYELNNVTIQRNADKAGEYEELVLWVVHTKPEVDEITDKLKDLASRYQKRGISRFVSRLRNNITPYDSD